MANEAISYDETQTAFSILPAQFPSSNEEKIKTKDFLEASSAAINLVERFGKVFSPITYDMKNNIKKLHDTYDKDRKEHNYLEDMITKEMTAQSVIATDALLWLKRALRFFNLLFECVIEDTDSEDCSLDLTGYIQGAYSDTLEEYHGWLGKQLINVLCRFAPNRRHLIYTLALEKHNREPIVIRDMETYNQKLGMCVKRLHKFYKDQNLEPNAAVY